MTQARQDSLNARRLLTVGDARYAYYSLQAAQEAGFGDVARLPFSLKVLLENLLRNEDGRSVNVEDIKALVGWTQERRSDREIAYRPTRVLMQDFTGVPAVVDLAAMRDAMAAMGGDPEKINPLSAVDLVIDHSVMVDHFGSSGAFRKNVKMEFERNQERYEFLRWGREAFRNFRVVPPGTGICHQVNLEYLAKVVWTSQDKEQVLAYPDTLVGTDSHTTMVNGLSVLGWGVGGIEAEAAMLGQPISMLIPEVVGFKLTGTMKEGTTATDLVLTVTQMLRAKGVVGKFVEFFGPGLDQLSLADRATISNMSPEYGATCGIFPIDKETLHYLNFTGRDAERVALVEAYAKEQGMWRDETTPDPVFTDTLSLDLAMVEPSLAGPSRPQDRVALSQAATAFDTVLSEKFGVKSGVREVQVANHDYKLSDGDVVIAAITSCTNTSNPSVLVAAGLLARNAVRKGLAAKSWVKTSFAPGSQVVTDYLEAAGLQAPLDELGFQLVGYGCTTCIGNSGPLDKDITSAIEANDLAVSAVLSGNRNFEGRIHANVKASYLASPPLVVAYALAGSMRVDLYNDPLGIDRDGTPVFLRDLWPANEEIQNVVETSLTSEMFHTRYSEVFTGGEEWQRMGTTSSLTYDWKDKSTYVQRPPYFVGMSQQVGDFENIVGARALVILGDSVTTDHISPAGAIKADSPAGQYLIANNVEPLQFNSYGSRRGNHEIMMRGTFANIRLRNEMAPGTTGGVTRHMPSGEQMSIYDAAMRYKSEAVPLVVIAGKEYGAGSSRDWAAKGSLLLGVRAVIAESFERIHRSNLVGMGILPLLFTNGATRKTLKLDGSETYDLIGLDGEISPRMSVQFRIVRADGSEGTVTLECRIDTMNEIEYYKNGGILQFVLRQLLAKPEDRDAA
ncbi:MAG: aconitate hydratase AcnA [Proteobacteria bacterium]|nr:MAG: aconitate hydratase AcnA [Pseudomonadota bacterium]